MKELVGDEVDTDSLGVELSESVQLASVERQPKTQPCGFFVLMRVEVVQPLHRVRWTSIMIPWDRMLGCWRGKSSSVDTGLLVAYHGETPRGPRRQELESSNPLGLNRAKV